MARSASWDHGEAGADQRRGTDPAQDPGRQVGPDDEPSRRRQRPQARLQRRQPQDELEVLGDEQEVADGDEDAEQVGGQGGVERRALEQPEVDHRVGQGQLPAREQQADDQPDQDGAAGQPAEPVLGAQLQPEHHRQHRDQRHGRAEQVQPARLQVLVLGEDAWPQRQQQRHHRHGQ
jgi:hypothetical protein